MEKTTWKEDLEKIINGLPQDFTLVQIYEKVLILAESHPGNSHPKAKIRQVLQQLRDQGKIRFLEPGKYQRVS